MKTDIEGTIKPESMLTLIKLPDLLSILNALLGFSAILFVLDDRDITDSAIKHALVLILLATVIDGLDGMVARKTESSPLGKYLDSLADMISFGIATAIIIYVLSKEYFAIAAPYSDVVLVFCGAYVISGMLRLARFNINLAGDEKSLSKERRNAGNYFEGFPITASAMFLASFMLLAIELRIPSSLSAPLLIGLTGLLCLLMTSRIRYKKLRDRRIAVPLGLVFLALFALYLFSSAFVYPALAVVTLTAFYMLTPLLNKNRQKFM